MNDKSIHPHDNVRDIRQHRALRALAFLVTTIRQDWDEPGVEAACLKALANHSLPEVALAALQACQMPACRTPGVIPLPGPHWRLPGAAPLPERYVPPPDPGPISERTHHLISETRRKLRYRTNGVVLEGEREDDSPVGRQEV